MTVIGTLELPGEVGNSRAARLRRNVLGPRLVDGPIHGVALLLMVLQLLPSNFDLPGVLYAGVVMVSAALTLLATWFPAVTALLSTLGFLTEILLFPATFGNFSLPLLVAGAVALTHRR